MPNSLITIGKIARPHGIKGELALDSEASLEALQQKIVYLSNAKDSPKAMNVRSVRMHSGRPLITFENITDRNEAETLRGLLLQIPVDTLPELSEDEYYLHDIIGLTIKHADTKQIIGTLVHAYTDTAQELWEITTADGKEILFPAVPEFVTEINLETEEILITPPEGLLELYLNPAPPSPRKRKQTAPKKDA